MDWIYKLLYNPCTDVNKMLLFKTGPNVLRESWDGDGVRGREQNRAHGGEHRPAVAPADWAGAVAEVGRLRYRSPSADPATSLRLPHRPALDAVLDVYDSGKASDELAARRKPSGARAGEPESPCAQMA